MKWKNAATGNLEQKEERMRKVLAFIAGLSIGFVTGGTLMILFAPEEGEALRSRLREEIERLVAEGKAAAEARRAELEAQLEALKQGQVAA